MKVVWGERTKRMVGEEEEDATNQPPSQVSVGERPFVSAAQRPRLLQQGNVSAVIRRDAEHDRPSTETVTEL